MAKFKANDLQEMIRSIVREEIKEVVTTTISEVLSERYLRQLAESTVAAAKPRGVANLDIMGDPEEEDEEIPHPLQNSILGVGQENPVFKKVPKSDGVKQHQKESVDRNEMLSMFFEGTKPLAQQEQEVQEGVPLPVESPEVRRWAQMARAADQLAEQRRPMTTTKDPAAEEARLRKLREQLEVPAR